MRAMWSKKPSLRVAFVLVVFFSAIWFIGTVRAYSADDGASGGEVVITSPADGETVRGGAVDVIIELRDRGSRGDHVHLYIDGRLVKPLYGDKVAYTLNGLGSGTHTITVRIATKGHHVLDTEDSVRINVR